MTTLNWIDDLVERLGVRRLGDPSVRPSEAELLRLEGELGAPLPLEYRYFLERYGACILGDEDFKVVVPIAEAGPWGQRTRPEYFYPLLRDDPDDLYQKLRTYAGRLPAGVLAIVPDAGGNQVCLDVAGAFPGSVWFWDHEQRWFKENLDKAAEELEQQGVATRRSSAHDIIRGWARLHQDRWDRPADYMGMYRIAPSFAEFLRALQRVPYE